MGQTLHDWEWIIIDGASTDGTQDDFKDYPQARITSEPDDGIYDAMNKGLEKATGDYIIFMNAGDMFADDEVLKTIHHKIGDGRPDFIYGDSWENGPSGRHYKKARPHRQILWGMFTHHQAMLYRRAALKNLKFNTQYTIAADYDLTLQFLNGHTETLYIPIPICVFESGGISQTRVMQGRQEQYVSRAHHTACSISKNSTIYGLQTLIWQVRSYLPALYWFLKKSG